MKKTIAVRLSEELRSDLEALSQAEHKPVSELVRESIRRYVAIRQFSRLRGRILPFAEAQGLLTDEDVFESLE